MFPRLAVTPPSRKSREGSAAVCMVDGPTGNVIGEARHGQGLDTQGCPLGIEPIDSQVHMRVLCQSGSILWTHP